MDTDRRSSRHRPLHTGARVALGVVALAVLLAGAAAAAAAPAHAASPGDRLWVRPYDPTADNDVFVSSAKGPSGSVYVAGSVHSGAPGEAAAIIRYSSAGAVLWQHTYAGPSGSTSAVTSAVVAGATGAAYLVGTVDSAAGADIFIRKYSSAGSVAWTKFYNGMGAGDDVAKDAAIDGHGNVYICGSSVGTLSTGPNMIVIKYKSTGSRAWSATYTGPGVGAPNDDDVAYAVTVDTLGDSYVVGTSNDGSGAYDTATVKFKPNGDTAWSRRLHLGVADENPQDIAVAVDGHVFITGSTTGGMSTRDNLFVARYASSGTKNWARSLDIGGGNEYGTVIKVNGAGYAFVAGDTTAPATTFMRALLTKWSPTGGLVWRKTFYVGISGDSAGWLAMALDGFGNVYCGGYSSGTGHGEDFTVAKYTTGGKQSWGNVYNKSGSSNDELCWSVLPLSGGVFGTGRGGGSALLIKYKP